MLRCLQWSFQHHWPYHLCYPYIQEQILVLSRLSHEENLLVLETMGERVAREEWIILNNLRARLAVENTTETTWRQQHEKVETEKKGAQFVLNKEDTVLRPSFSVFLCFSRNVTSVVKQYKYFSLTHGPEWEEMRLGVLTQLTGNKTNHLQLGKPTIGWQSDKWPWGERFHYHSLAGHPCPLSDSAFFYFNIPWYVYFRGYAGTLEFAMLFATRL